MAITRSNPIPALLGLGMLFGAFVSANAQEAAPLTPERPESAEFDPARDRLLASDVDGGAILALTRDGAWQVFTDDPERPYGIELLDDVLYVLDAGHVRGYAADTAARVFEFAVPDVRFLNGITSDGVDTLYFTDMQARLIHRLRVTGAGAPEHAVLASTGEASPNGVVHDAANDRLLIVTWRERAQVLALALGGDDAVPETLIQTPLTSIDGVALDCNGSVYVTGWNQCPGTHGGCLVRFDPPFSVDATPHMLAGGLDRPADIDFDPGTGLIAIPQSGTRVVTTHASTCPARGHAGH